MAGIHGKVVAITGASSGIGEATALMLAGRGARVVLGARGPDRLAALARRIEGDGGEVAFRSTDVRRRGDVADLVALGGERFGRLDVLVSNAGISPIGPLDDLKVEDWDNLIDVNLRGFLYGIAAALPLFRAQKSGHFVTVISTAGIKIVPGQVVYAGTKNAVRTIMEGLRQEAGPHLRVTGVSPGFVRTNLADSISDPTMGQQIQQRMAEIAISPDAIARAIAFAIEQPDDVDVGDIIVRPTAQT